VPLEKSGVTPSQEAIAEHARALRELEQTLPPITDAKSLRQR
jgi:hypothetical protein